MNEYGGELPPEYYTNEFAESKSNDILANIRLDFADLAGKQVLDIGAPGNLIERAAKSRGISSIISLDINPTMLNPDLKSGVAADAKLLPFVLARALI